jgi:hypothetical protein
MATTKRRTPAFRLTPEHRKLLLGALPLRDPADAEQALAALELSLGWHVEPIPEDAEDQRDPEQELTAAARAAAHLRAALGNLGRHARHALATHATWQLHDALRPEDITHAEGRLVAPDGRELNEFLVVHGREVATNSVELLEKHAAWLERAATLPTTRKKPGPAYDWDAYSLARRALAVWVKYTDMVPTRSGGAEEDRALGIARRSPWEDFVAVVFEVVRKTSKGSDRYARHCIEFLKASRRFSDELGAFLQSRTR